MTDFKLSMSTNMTGYEPTLINLRCPICLNQGAFHGIAVNDMQWSQDIPDESGRKIAFTFKVGIRKCPTPNCGAPIFVVFKNHILFRSFPPEVIDFDATDIPPGIQATLKEAINCHANECYKAGGIMVRRTLEELCADRQATGENLKKRIEALRTKIVVSQELLDAADELRLFGNDAAHIDAEIYDDIGKEEVEAAIDLAKELLKAVYQHSSLVERLKAFRKKNQSGDNQS